MLSFQIDATSEWRKLFTELVAATRLHYICGYDLNSVFEQGVFVKLSMLTGGNFCYELSALAMFVVSTNHTARLVRGIATIKENGESGSHSIVEMEYGENTYILDYAWAAGVPIQKSVYLQLIGYDTKWVCTNDDFWSRQAIWNLYRCSCSAERSYTLLELGAYFRPEETDDGYERFDLWHGDEAVFQRPDLGQTFHPYPGWNGTEINKLQFNLLMV